MILHRLQINQLPKTKKGYYVSHTYNKEPKDSKLLKVVRATINNDRKRNGFTMEEEANELGLTQGTLEQKLKPSAPLDLTVSEITHIIDLSGDYSILEYLANKYNFKLVKRDCCEQSLMDLTALVDKAMIEGQDIFRVAKVALSDGNITDDEKEKILKEIDDADKVHEELRAQLSTSK